MNEFDLFQSALDLEDPTARRKFLQSHCEHDAELLKRVEALLASHEGQSQFLATPAVQQIVDISDARTAATMLAGNGLTADDEVDATKDFNSPGPAAMASHQDDPDDEIPLGYLQPSDKPGTLGRLAHYEVLEVLGRGAFGIVLKAFDEKLQRVVAIKVLSPEMAATSPARKRFLREARSSAAVRHEHVVNIYAVEEQPIPYLVMEYIPGQTLQQRLDGTGPLPVMDVLRLGRQIAEGLAAAGAQGLIHRDIKPGNILLEAGVHERVKITDFGLARAADDASMTQSGLIAGTPMYMAPEQALGHKLDQRADLFSLGSVLYQMLSGRPPFRAASTLAVLKRVTEETPRPIGEIIPETPQWICSIITKLHAKNPDDRYQSAREVADVLAHCEAQLNTSAKLQDFSKIPRMNSAASSGRGKWIAAAVLLIPLLALAVLETSGVTQLFRSTSVPPTVVNGTVDPKPTEQPVVTAPAEAEWVSLFNGNDLTGWKTQPDAPGHWEVKDGILTGRRLRSALFSARGDYANFHLRAEVRVNQGGDSGILFRTGFDTRRGDEVWPPGGTAGYEVEILKIENSARKTGSVESIQRNTGPRAFGLNTDDSLTQPDEWFTLELIAAGNSFFTKINGQETANCIDSLHRDTLGHIALQVWDFNTVVQLRKIEIKELPATEPATPSDPQPRHFASDEWIDVIPLIDPKSDKWDMRLTGKNDWRIEQGELVVGGTDDKPGKLLLPLDSNFLPSFECELEVTRRKGEQGFNFNFPTAKGDTALNFDVNMQRGDAATKRGVFLRHSRTGPLILTEATQIETGKRTTFRFEVRRQQTDDRIKVWNNGTLIGSWTGDRYALASINNEGYPHHRRLSLWVHGGEAEFVFHRIRVRTLDGGTADSLRPVPLEPSQIAERRPADAPSPAVAPFDTAQAKAHQEAWAKYLGVPVEYTNSIGMKFRLIPPGEFTMGSTAEEIEVALKEAGEDKHWQECIKSESPQHTVILTQPIYLGVNEVTQGEYEKVMGVNPSHFAPMGMGKEAVAGLQTTEHPVETVSWNDATEFCSKLSQQEKLKPFYFRTGETVTPLDGTGYRLPSEAEWEFACRAGTATKYWVGDQDEDLARAGWFGGNSDGRTHAAGALKANPFGLSDIHGNVWEWVQDGWDATYYGQFSEKSATNPNSPFSAGSQRVLRGADWLSSASFCRSALRLAYDPPVRNLVIGFRVSLSVDAVKASLAARMPAVTNTKSNVPSPAIAPFDAAQAKAHQEAWAKHLSVPVEYTNSIGMKFRLIPPGEFMMGSTPEEIDAALIAAGNDEALPVLIRSEAPRHKVILTQPIYIGVTEVTQTQYQQVMGTNPSHFSATGNGQEAVAGLQTTEHPVEMVSWNDAAEFCAKLSQQENLKPFYSRSDESVTPLPGTGYRLPTEAEWESACRAGTTTRYWSGDEDQDLTAVGWSNSNSSGRTHAAGELRPNPFGLLDVHGNVWELVQDGWSAGSYGKFQDVDAINPSNDIPADSRRAIRGGFYDGHVQCRSSAHLGVLPTLRHHHLGFRVVLAVDAVNSPPVSVAPFTAVDVQRIAALPVARSLSDWWRADRLADTIGIVPSEPHMASQIQSVVDDQHGRDHSSGIAEAHRSAFFGRSGWWAGIFEFRPAGRSARL